MREGKKTNFLEPHTKQDPHLAPQYILLGPKTLNVYKTTTKKETRNEARKSGYLNNELELNEYEVAVI